MVGRKVTRRRQRGLTLVELLVVVAILAIASSVVMLTAPPLRPKVRDDAERFAARLQLALDQSISSTAPMRLSLDAKGYAFETFGPEGWAAIDKIPALSPQLFDKRTTATAEIDDASNGNSLALGAEEEEGEEGIYLVPLDALGAQQSFGVTFTSADGGWNVRLDATGGVTVTRDE